MFYYVYVLRSRKDGNLYIGFTPDLKSRLIKHKNGKVSSTKYRRPLEVIYFEAYQNKNIAQIRERRLKNGKAHTALRKRLGL